MSISGILIRIGIGAITGVAAYFIIKRIKEKKNGRNETDRKEV
ncbi:hypothetical protein [uncultured Treponema sp.]|nr:hypothetical protein [uncultured Treponema sp.]